MTSVTDAESRLFGAERAKAFIDAVVAIAMTLLILPLMESISDASEVADAEASAAQWFGEHLWQLGSFVLSFVIIAMFWINHHRVFTLVERVTPTFLWICMAWLLTIVWLPVATAMSGRMDSDDPVVKTVYIGSMVLTSLVVLVQRLYLRSHPELHTMTPDLMRRGLAAELAMLALFTASLVVAVTVPAIGYYAMFLMGLTGVVQRLFARVLPKG